MLTTIAVTIALFALVGLGSYLAQRGQQEHFGAALDVARETLVADERGPLHQVR